MQVGPLQIGIKLLAFSEKAYCQIATSLAHAGAAECLIFMKKEGSHLTTANPQRGTPMVSCWQAQNAGAPHYSRACQEGRSAQGSVSEENRVSLRYSSRSQPMRLSMKAFCRGLPGSM